MNTQNLLEKLFAESECLTAALDIDKDVRKFTDREECDFKTKNPDKLCRLA